MEFLYRHLYRCYCLNVRTWKRFFSVCFSNHLIFTNCIIPRETLIGKIPTTKYSIVPDNVIKVVYNIKIRPLKSRIRKELCDNVASNYNLLVLLYKMIFLDFLQGKLQPVYFNYAQNFVHSKKRSIPQEDKRIMKLQKNYDSVIN